MTAQWGAHVDVPSVILLRQDTHKAPWVIIFISSYAGTFFTDQTQCLLRTAQKLQDLGLY